MIHPLFATLRLALLAIQAPPAFLAPSALPAPRYEFTELHMGMAVRIVLHAPDQAAARRAAEAGFDRIAALEDVFSDYRSGSELRQLEQRAEDGGWTSVSPELLRVLIVARMVAEESRGAFDPTVGPLVALWRESRRTGRLPEPAALASAREQVGWRHLEISQELGAVRLARPGVRLDLGGVAKGYILGEALLVLRHHGTPAALIEAGGDIVLGDTPPGRPGWDIGLDGIDPSPLSNTAIATSGTSAQFVTIDGVRYAHIVDPRTGLGLTHQAQVTVIGPDPALADALATAAVVLRPSGVHALMMAYPGYRIVVVGSE